MTLVSALTLLAVLVGTAFTAAEFAARRPRIHRLRFKSSVIVTLQSGATFEGVLFDFDRHALVLRDAKLLSAGQRAPVAVDGEVVLLRDRVEYMQKP